MTHYRKVCKHGTLVTQCRCPTPGKQVIIVPCPLVCPQFELEIPKDMK